MKRVGFALVLTMCAAHAAAADVCVALDESRDTLSPEDRRAAQISFAQALAKAGQRVGGPEGCTGTYTFYNVKLGATISVYVTGPGGVREGRATKLDELPLVYEQLASSLVTGKPMGSLDNVDRTNATADQMAPRRVAADNLKYFRLGYGAVSGKSTTLGTAFGFGYRHELDHIAVDVSFLNLVWAHDSGVDSMGVRHDEGGVNGELIGLGVLNYQQPLANTSLYYGARIGYGVNDFYDSDRDTNYSGGGIQVTGIIGYETLRASTIRLFVELDATAPLYTSTNFDESSRRWAPVIALSIGAGLGKSNTINVVNR